MQARSLFLIKIAINWFCFRHVAQGQGFDMKKFNPLEMSKFGMSKQIMIKNYVQCDKNDATPISEELFSLRAYIVTKEEGDDKYVEFFLNESEELQDNGFNNQLQTVFLVHGYLEKPLESEWINAAAERYMNTTKYNVLIIDWSDASGPPYKQAAANTKTAAESFKKIVQFVKEDFGLQMATMNIVAQGMGVHVFGIAAEGMDKLKRITALDPCGPCFDDLTEEEKLSEQRARFVDVIHTNSNGFGTEDVMGHMDFFPNKGETQPECEKTSNDFNIGNFREAIYSRISCDHMMAAKYFYNSFDCDFPSKNCESWQAFKDNECSDLKKTKAPLMGYKAIKYKQYIKDEPKFYLYVDKEEPYCLETDAQDEMNDKGSNSQSQESGEKDKNAMPMNFKKMPSFFKKPFALFSGR